MELLQVGNGDCHHARQLRCAAVRIGGPINKLRRLAARDLSYVVVSSNDAGSHLLLREIELARIELRMHQQVRRKTKDGVEIRLEARPAHARRVNVAVGLHLRSLGLQQVVHRIAGFARRSAGTPDISIQRDHTGL